jgi:hypothetical protein
MRKQILITTQYIYGLAKITDGPRGQDIATDIIMAKYPNIQIYNPFAFKAKKHDDPHDDPRSQNNASENIIQHVRQFKTRIVKEHIQ